MAKTQRGLPNRADKKIDLSYWVDRNFNHVEDISIQRMSGETKAGMAKWLADDELYALHETGLKWHVDCANTTLNEMEGMRLFARIISLTRTDLNPRIAMRLGQMLIKGRQREKTRKDVEKGKN